MLTGNKTAKSATPKAGFCMAVYRKVSHGSHFRVSQAMVERKGADDARMEHPGIHDRKLPGRATVPVMYSYCSGYCTGKKTPGGAGTHTGHTRDTRDTRAHGSHVTNPVQ